MDARKTIIATSFFSAALVLGVIVPLGYFGLQALQLKLETGQSEVQRVIIDLKTEAVKEIRATAEQVAIGLAKNSPQSDPTIVASLAQLKTDIDALRSDQQKFFEKTERPSRPIEVVSAPASPVTLAPPGSRDDTLNQSVFFPLGKITGPIIEKQVVEITQKISAYGLNQQCRSNVMGFSDTLGGDKSNLELSEKRALHVATLLRTKQIVVGDVKGWGERWLKVHTVDGIANEQNRRVVIETLCKDNAPKAAAPVS